jgi:acetylornithine deacetylase/succinyl-diaminopimelate desuccinylase-like protein
MQAVREAYLRGWGVEPKLSRDGGSIPIVADMQEHLKGAAILLMPFGYKAGGAHSINESCDLGMVERGIHTMLHFYELITSHLPDQGD